MKLLFISGNPGEGLTPQALTFILDGQAVLAFDEPGGCIGHVHTGEASPINGRATASTRYEEEFTVQLKPEDVAWLNALTEEHRNYEEATRRTAEQLRALALQLQVPEVKEWHEVYFQRPAGERVRPGGHRTPARHHAQRRRARLRAQKQARRHNR